MCLIGKTQLLCMQCRGIGPHLVATGKSHGFSRVAPSVPLYNIFLYSLKRRLVSEEQNSVDFFALFVKKIACRFGGRLTPDIIILK